MTENSSSSVHNKLSTKSLTEEFFEMHDSGSHYIKTRQLENEIGSRYKINALKKALQLFNSVDGAQNANQRKSPNYYRKFLFSLNTLLHESLFEDFLNFPKDYRIILFEKIINVPNTEVVGVFIRSFEKLDRPMILINDGYASLNDFMISLYSEHSKNEVISNEYYRVLGSLMDDNYEYSKDLTQSAALLLRLVYGEKSIVEILGRRVQEYPGLKLKQLEMLLDDWENLKEHPIDWSLSLLPAIQDELDVSKFD